MCSQIEDFMVVNKRRYTIVSMEIEGKDDIFTPLECGITPVMMHTGCYRGYHCTYKIARGALYLAEFTVRKLSNTYPLKRFPIINGIRPVKDEYASDIGRYKGLRMPMLVSGRVRLGSGFNSDSGKNMGFCETADYRHIRDLELREGRVVSDIDRTAEIGKMREVQQEVTKFLEQYWVPGEWVARLESSYAFVDEDDIDRTFSRSIEPIDPAGALTTLDSVKKLQAEPRWLIVNFADYYERAHQYSFDFAFLAGLGCPPEIIQMLKGLTSHTVSERQAGVAFMEQLRTTLAGELWGDTLHYIIGRQFVQANVKLEIAIAIANNVAGVTLDSWQL